MRPIRQTIPVAEALELVLQAAVPIGRTERVALSEADGRVIASTVTAAADVPPFDRAAMDGFAVVAEDTAGATGNEPGTLRCVGNVHAGRMPSRGIVSGECVAIATGAPVPEGATAVVMVEDTEQPGETEIRVLKSVSAGQNVSPRGADLKTGDVVSRPGQLVNPSLLGALAAAGVDEVEVYARPVVAILSTGDEIVEPGRPLGFAQIYDINRFTLSAVVTRHGGTPHVPAIAGDTLRDISEGLERAAVADIVVFSGGSSAGDKDLIVDVLRASGDVIFHGIAVKPGKPTILGRVRGKPFLGMPGNPTSCLSNAYLLLTPLLRRTARLPEYKPRTTRLPLARHVVSTPGRHQLYPVKIVDGAAVPAFKASGDITSMSEADGYFEIDAHRESLEAGEIVEVKFF